MNLILVLFTAVCFSANAVLMKFAGGKIDSLSGVFFWSLGAIIAGVFCILWQKSASQITVSSAGMLFTFLAGFLMALGIATYIVAFNKGADFSFVTPIVNITVVMTGVVLGYFIFSESFSVYRVLGVILGVTSIFLLARG